MWCLPQPHRSFEGPDYAIPNGPEADEALFKMYAQGIVKANATGPVMFTTHTLGVGGKINGLNRTIAFLKDSGYTFTTVRFRNSLLDMHW